MIKKITQAVYFFMCLAIVVQSAGCGTILYPERKGQTSGRIDVGVAALDAVGLFFFLIPGIIAYAVDFSNGTIYLPGGARGSLDIENIKEVSFDPKNASMAAIEKIVKEETGYDVSRYGDRVKIVALKSSEEMMRLFAEVLPKIENKHIALRWQ